MRQRLVSEKIEKKGFSEMSQQEKQRFLSMDLIERMIRVEQRVSAHFHKLVPYNKTEFYMSLSEKEKKAFEKYLKNKKMKSFLKMSAFFALIILFLLQGVRFTGLVIQEGGYFSLIDAGIFFLTAIVFFVFVALFFFHMKRKGRFDDHAAVLEKAVYKQKV